MNDARWLALDVGGANLKAAHGDGWTRTVPFEVWKRPDALEAVLAALAGSAPRFDSVAVTMTAELCDCYPTRRAGVLAIVAAVTRALAGHTVLFWGTDGRFHQPDAIVARPMRAAAANWLALATVGARLGDHGPGILIDVGSTTTDLIPLDRGRVAALGRTDRERLETGELVYAGVRRTPVCALGTELPGSDGRPVGLAAELFATTLDVFLMCGDIRPDEADTATADGRPATLAHAHDRLARMVGADREDFIFEDAQVLARAAADALMQRLIAAARRVCAGTIGAPGFAVVAGSGEFLARRLAVAVLGPDRPVHSTTELWGGEASTAACAWTLRTLAREWRMDENP